MSSLGRGVLAFPEKPSCTLRGQTVKDSAPVVVAAIQIPPAMQPEQVGVHRPRGVDSEFDRDLRWPEVAVDREDLKRLEFALVVEHKGGE